MINNCFVLFVVLSSAEYDPNGSTQQLTSKAHLTDHDGNAIKHNMFELLGFLTLSFSLFFFFFFWFVFQFWCDDVLLCF